MQFELLKRREFITLLGGAMGWPLSARAQQGGKPVIGYLGPVSAETFTDLMSQFRRGLREAGVADSHSIPIEYRWRAADMEWPVLAAGLVERKVAVVATAGDAATRAVKAATTAIPIVFVLGSDPVEAGLVASLSRPGGNLTGATTLNLELSAKRVEVVRELLPKAAHVVLLVNPSSVATAEALIRETKAAAVRYELRISVLRASTDHEIETAFAALQELRADTLLVSPDAFLNTRGGKLGGLAARHAIPAIAPTPAFASAGGLL